MYLSTYLSIIQTCQHTEATIEHMANAFLPTHVQLILVFINLIIYDHAKIFMTKRTDQLPSGILPVCH